MKGYHIFARSNSYFVVVFVVRIRNNITFYKIDLVTCQSIKMTLAEIDR